MSDLVAALIQSLDDREAQLNRAVVIIEGLLSSFEAYCYLNEPLPEEQQDEYDRMMKPRWEAAQRFVETAHEPD